MISAPRICRCASRKTSVNNRKEDKIRRRLPHSTHDRGMKEDGGEMKIIVVHLSL